MPRNCRGRRRASFIAGAGAMTSSTHTTPQATTCIVGGGPPRISVAALVKLMQWCQARRGQLTGESLCPTPVDPASPPAPPAHDTARPADRTLVEPAAADAAANPAGPQPTHCQEPPAGDGEGGRS